MAEVTRRRYRQAASCTPRSVAIPYDFLVLATGATHSYFGHDEWAEVAPGLKRIEDATRIRRRILIAFERAELTQRRRPSGARLLTFVIVGGGATGVEMAGAIAEIARQTLANGLSPHRPTHLAHRPDRGRAARAAGLARRICRTTCSATLDPQGRRGDDLDARDRLRSARRRSRARPHRRRAPSSGRPAWSPRRRRAGSTPSMIAPGACRSAPICRCRGHPDVFVIGDTAAAIDQAGRAVPGIAPAAKQMGALCRAADRGADRRHAGAGAVPLSPPGRSRHHRAARRGGEARPPASSGLRRLAVLERGPHLSS